MKFNDELWEKLLQYDNLTQEQQDNMDYADRDIVNKLDKYDLNTILCIMDFFGATTVWMRQTAYDLIVPKFRVFDWLAMCVMGRNDDDRKRNNVALKVLIHSFIKVNGNERAWIADLVNTDYEVNRGWKYIKIDIKESKK